MFTDMTRTRNRGFILPVALILMAFATTVLVTAGIMVQRTSDRLNSYSLLSDLRITTNNLVEIATMVLASKWTTAEFDDSWSGYDDFVAFVSSRGGYEGALWGELLDSIGNNENWWNLGTDIDFAGILDDEAFTEYNNKGAVINHTEGDYSIISWAERGGVIRYSYGLATTESLAGKPALLFGETPRVFHEINTYVPNGNNATETIRGRGDLINGKATVVGTVTVSGVDVNLERIFQYGIEANNVIPESDNYNYTKTASAADLVFSSLLGEHEKWLSELTRTATFDFLPESVFPEIEEGFLIPIVPNDKNDTQFTIEFPEINKISPDASGYFTLSYKDQTVTINEAEYQINLVIYGDLRIGDKNPSVLKISSVNGKYSITVVKGDIQVNTHLVYGDFREEFDEATKQGGVVFNQPILTWNVVKHLLNNFSAREADDYLSLTSIGGNISATYVIGNNGTAAHEIRALAGDYSAFPLDGAGGGFIFPDLEDLASRGNDPKAGQLFIFGSVIAKYFGRDDQLDFIDNFFVSSSQETLGGGSTSKRLVLLGLRAW